MTLMGSPVDDMAEKKISQLGDISIDISKPESKETKTEQHHHKR